MNNKLMLSLLVAAAIYIMVAALFGAGVKLMATQVPAGRMDPQFAPVTCSLAVACLQPEGIQSIGSFEKSSLQTAPEGK